MAGKGDFKNYLDILDKDLGSIDRFTQKLISLEEERQARKIILIPSESMAPRSVRKALGSVFNNVYAEGYPREEMTQETGERLADLVEQLGHYRRYADRRFYKGVEYADLVESLAQRRVAECFVADQISADKIYVNIQPLSGAAANLAIYETFVNPGDTVMGMDLSEGGHLTHGSQFNITGKRYNIVSYSTKRTTGKLDYEEIEKLAVESKPRMIIVGYTSYPWAPDWERFREIADKVGAVLLADIAHTAGMAIAGVYPNPIGYADAVMFTTHKTVCGPRGAVILTTNREYSEMINEAIFPGEQGGPHVNKFAAISVAFKIAQTESFKKMQHRIVENAKALASRLQKNGITLAYGGTDTHLMVIDLRELKSDTGFAHMGEACARILDLCGVVTNKNTIPGDESAADAHGIRLGTPWVTQRGMETGEMKQIADVITKVLTNIKPFCYIGAIGDLSRGKIDLEVLEEAKKDVARITKAKPPPVEKERGYPYFWSLPEEEKHKEKLFMESLQAANPDDPQGLALVDLSDRSILEISGHRPTPFLQEVSTNGVGHLKEYQAISSFLLDKDGKWLDSIAILRTGKNRWGQDRYLVITTPQNTEQVKAWFRGLSDGYIIFDKEDIFRKVQGPITVRDLSSQNGEVVLKLTGNEASNLVESLGDRELKAGLEKNRGGAFEIYENKIDLFSDLTSQDTQQFYLVVDYSHAKEVVDLLTNQGATLCSSTERDMQVNTLSRSPRPSGLNLYKKGHKDQFDLSKPYFVGQPYLLNEISTHVDKKEFKWEAGGKKGKRTPLYEEHKKLGAKMTGFAGWIMPVWYTRVADEHMAVRKSAGLFDLGHMGVFEVAGKYATSFLDTVTSNYVRWLKDGQSQYSYLLDPAGKALDDIIVYRRGANLYLLVVNAVNEDKDWEWLKAVNSTDYLIDKNHPIREVEGQATLRNLKDPSSGDRQRINVALQGRNSLQILKKLIADCQTKKRLDRLAKNELVELELSDIPVIVSHTGYTGEEVGFEIFVHPEQAPGLWNMLLDAGKGYGIKPAGLGARDSLRIEAGLPLYGHELEGEYGINPTEAGFGPYIKFHKPFFIGRDQYMHRTQKVDREVARFKIEKRARAIRRKAPVIDRTGKYIGRVTSCTLVGDGQVGMAYIEKRYHRQDEKIGIFALPPSGKGREDKLMKELEKGDKLPLYYWARVLPRFPGEDSTKSPFLEFTE